MTKRLSNYPHLLHEQGVKNVWVATIKQAVEDLNGAKEDERESANTTFKRVLEAYHWLMTDRSEEAFRIQGVDPDSIRAAIRRKITTGIIQLDLTRSFARHNHLTTTSVG